MARSLRPGGTLILEAFSKKQLERGTGGPRDPDLLYETVDLREDFEELKILTLEDCDVELNEGRYHLGAASVVRMLASA